MKTLANIPTYVRCLMAAFGSSLTSMGIPLIGTLLMTFAFASCIAGFIRGIQLIAAEDRRHALRRSRRRRAVR